MTTSEAVNPAMLAKGIAALRIAIGATALAAPAAMAGPWIGAQVQHPGTQLLARAMGMRDVALGAGALLALVHGDDARDWVRLGALSDAVDAVLTAAAFRRLPTLGRWGVLASASGAALAGLWAAATMEPRTASSTPSAAPRAGDMPVGSAPVAQSGTSSLMTPSSTQTW
jgi:hypothetical protein